MSEDTERQGRLERLRTSAQDWAPTDPQLEMGGMIEAAYLMAAADGDLSETEYDQLAATIEYISQSYLQADQIQGTLEQLGESLRIDGWEARIAAIASSLPSPESRRNAYRLAAGVSFIDGLIQEEEERLFGLLAEAFGIAPEEATLILTEVRDEIFAPPT